MTALLSALETRLGHTFRSRGLLEQAVTHSSFIQDHPETPEHNQRLEFLGDAVLQLILTETLFTSFPGDREGLLSKRRAALANGAFLSRLAKEIGLDVYLRLGASEESTGGRDRTSSLGDAFEAVVGAVYIDSDFSTVRAVVLGLYGSLPERLAVSDDANNPKGQLQEMIQSVHGNGALRYTVVAMQGEDHAREYEVEVLLNEVALGRGRGSSKKLAEEAAARAALVFLRNDPFASQAGD